MKINFFLIIYILLLFIVNDNVFIYKKQRYGENLLSIEQVKNKKTSLTTTIKGIIIDKGNDKRYDNEKATVIYKEQRVTPNAEGKFILKMEDEANFKYLNIEVIKKGRFANIFAMEYNEEKKEIKFRLTNGDQFKGIIKDKNGKPIPNALIYFGYSGANCLGYDALSNEKGEFIAWNNCLSGGDLKNIMVSDKRDGHPFISVSVLEKSISLTRKSISFKKIDDVTYHVDITYNPPIK